MFQLKSQQKSSINFQKKLVVIVLTMLMLATIFIPKLNVTTLSADVVTKNCKASVLIEQSTGKVLVESNSHDQLPIASVTKLMTVLITLENIHNGKLNLEDNIKISENASGMGGSQVFIEANQTYKLGELLKSVIVASANDSSVALAEHIAGSEANFVRLMNQRANELNLKNTNYVNCTGLPNVEGYSSAYDQALLLREVLKHDIYHTYSSIWMENFAHPTGRTTQMTNTNRLSRFYDGCIGGKTGSTNQAKYCLAVGAKRNNLGLIAVVLGAENSKDRFNISRELLDYGFENYTTKTLFSQKDLANVKIKIKGLNKATELKAEREYISVVPQNQDINFSLNYNLPGMLTSSTAGEVVGNVEVIINGVVCDTIDLMATNTIKEATLLDYIKEITNS